MDILIELFKALDVSHLLAMAVMMWILYTRIDQKIDKLEKKIDKVDEKVTDIDKRVFAIETMLHMKDCCMLKDSRMKEKAE